MKLKQVDLFLTPIPLCPFCGYPKLPMVSFKCDIGLALTLLGEDFSPFRVHWHTDLEEEERIIKRISNQISRKVADFYDANPELIERVKETRLNSWVEDHGPNQGQLERDFQEMCERLERRERHGGRIVPESQVSLISYIIGGDVFEREQINEES